MPRVATPFEKCYRVDQETGCWVWTRHIMASGYGARNLRRQSGKKPIISAHRASWELYRGAIPVGMNVLHKCDNRACVNPDHLFLGTQKENVADAVAKQRATQFVKRTYCRRGHKLTPSNVYLRPDTGYQMCRECLRDGRRKRGSRNHAWVSGLLSL